MKLFSGTASRVLLAVVGVAAALVMVEAPGAYAATGPVSPLVSCSTGYVCFYPAPNYGGTPCKWQDDDSDWQASPGVCSWSATQNVRSLYNQGTSGLDVLYFANAGYSDIVGCAGQYAEVTNVNFHLRSHFWGTC